MEAVAAQASLPTPDSSAYSSDESYRLSPPRVRQPYTPPPQKGSAVDEEGQTEELQPLQRSSSDMDGSVDTDTPESDKLHNMGICASPGESAYPAKRKRPGRSKKRNANEAQSLATMLRKGIVDHQLGLSLNVVLLVAFSWCLFPSLRSRLEGFFLLSYQSILPDGHAMCGQGPRDLYLVSALIVVFTGLRAFMLEYVLTPVAGLLGVQKERARTRFAEQSYLLLYYLLYWTWGLHLFIQATPTLNEDGSASYAEMLSKLSLSLWTGWPRLLMNPDMKFYYLSQLAFWIQQIVVVHLEEKRKDHYQMLTHHFVTVALMSTSYGHRQWRVGNAVLVCMDIIEIIFPTAKLLKYLGLQAACDAAFGLFVVMWLFARHGCYLSICWSVYQHFGGSEVLPYGTWSLTQTSYDPYNNTSSISGMSLHSDGGDEVVRHLYQPFFNPGAKTISLNPRIKQTFLGLLLGLQGITVMWFTMIVGVVIRVLRGQAADDTRSDDEGEDEEADDEEITGPVQPSKSTSVPFSTSAERPRFIEVETDSTEYVRRSSSTSGGSSTRRSRKGNSFTSGLNLGEHKDILNRIGCLSEEQLAREREKKGER